MKHIPQTCTRDGWMVSMTTTMGQPGAALSTWKVDRNTHKTTYDTPHPTFPNYEAARDYALAHGFLQVFYGRPSGFIDLRLSPRTRKYLRTKTTDDIWQVLPRILGVSVRDEYFYAVLTKSCMEGTHQRWLDSLKRGGSRKPTK